MRPFRCYRRVQTQLLRSVSSSLLSNLSFGHQKPGPTRLPEPPNANQKTRFRIFSPMLFVHIPTKAFLLNYLFQIVSYLYSTQLDQRRSVQRRPRTGFYFLTIIVHFRSIHSLAPPFGLQILIRGGNNANLAELVAKSCVPEASKEALMGRLKAAGQPSANGTKKGGNFSSADFFFTFL